MKVTGTELKSWREGRGLTQSQVGGMLNGVSHSAVNRWENGQEIPGPAQLLLGMLIRGDAPFPGVGASGSPSPAHEQKLFWDLRLKLEDWHKLESLASREGYADTKDFILSIIREELEAAGDDSQ